MQWYKLLKFALSKHIIQTLTRRFLGQDPNLTSENIKNYISRFEQYKQQYPQQFKEFTLNPDITSYQTFHEIEEAVDKIQNYIEQNKSIKYRSEQSSIPPIYENENIVIYRGDTPGDCVTIRRSLGNTTWCVAKEEAESNLFYRYRLGENSSTFYFGKRKKANPQDPYSIFALQVTKNNDFILTSKNNNGDKKLSPTQLTGVIPEISEAMSVLIPTPASKEEQALINKFRYVGLYTSEFCKLSKKEKMLYIDINLSLDDKKYQCLQADEQEKYINLRLPLSYNMWNNTTEQNKQRVLNLAKNGVIDYIKFLTVEEQKNIMINVVNKNGKDLQFAPHNLKNNKQVVLAAVKQNGLALLYASKNLKNNKQVVLEAVKQNGTALAYASANIKNDKQIVLESVKQYGVMLSYVSKNLQNNKQVVLEAVKQNGEALRYASETLQNDRQIVLEAVKQKGEALRYASETLRNDKHVVLWAIKNDITAFIFASDALKSNKEMVIEAIKINKEAIQYAPLKLRKDPEILAYLNSRSMYQ